jgi:hypothetical protein
VELPGPLPQRFHLLPAVPAPPAALRWISLLPALHQRFPHHLLTHPPKQFFLGPGVNGFDRRQRLQA